MYPSRLTKCRLVLEAPPLDMVVYRSVNARVCRNVMDATQTNMIVPII
jgi:hypothetical protein